MSQDPQGPRILPKTRVLPETPDFPGGCPGASRGESPPGAPAGPPGPPPESRGGTPPRIPGDPLGTLPGNPPRTMGPLAPPWPWWAPAGDPGVPSPGGLGYLPPGPPAWVAALHPTGRASGRSRVRCALRYSLPCRSLRPVGLPIPADLPLRHPPRGAPARDASLRSLAKPLKRSVATCSRAQAHKLRLASDAQRPPSGGRCRYSCPRCRPMSSRSGLPLRWTPDGVTASRAVHPIGGDADPPGTLRSALRRLR